MPRQPTIRDVAVSAGVSYQTVSRVLNDSPQVRPRTRDKVLAAIDDLGFRRSAAARALAAGRSGLIGILAAESHSFYGTATAMAAIEQAARDAGYRVPVVNAAPDAESLAAALEHLQREAVEAIVVLAPQERALEAIESLAIGVPFVTLGAAGRGADPRLLVDQAAGARLAAEHLLALGHTRIAHLAGPQHWVEAHARLDGFTARMAEAGLEPAAVIGGDWTAESGYRAGLRLLDEVADLTAVVAGNDQMALGLLHACADRGVRAPEDLSVVGFDDVPEAAHYRPPLTTIRQDFAEVGRRTIGVVLAELRGEPAAVDRPVPPVLVERDSTRAV
ncbi:MULTISPECIES: substrate-binding domain-containing protein [unclassified Rathayibacter]|uniref:LacI family DNA-binding transcriptional regulator n=1 Tax=unclassified Rathayibacter TaxID=2609250 RepID=UPI00104B19ED|nr:MULTISPECIES: substrate-binding domain-containing protein [unclassified Rathayibacter]MCJ1704074.1 substrate-binding domain-containing protein [Rathayibacter sp. VKM Ac-2926]TCL83271.1 LacI family transcriptional regulator [Rathayibacter sp. PhB192]TCM28769.1 LacI family transcriptional regulator [Rathayibacter sp. PhB179]